MLYKERYHVFYSGCADNTPKEPDREDSRYQNFRYRSNALVYAHDVVGFINNKSSKHGFVGVEYGVVEITIKEKKTVEQILKEIIQHQKEIIYFIMDETEPNRQKPLGKRQIKASELVKVCEKMIENV